MVTEKTRERILNLSFAGSVIAVIVMLAVIVGITISNPPESQPGITFSYSNYRINEIFEPGHDTFFKRTPVIFKFFSLDPNATYTLTRINYDRYDYDIISAETVHVFTNKTQIIMWLAVEREHFILFREGKPVIFITCIPQMIEGMI